MAGITTLPLQVSPPDQVAEVTFDDDMESVIADILTRYPDQRAALLPVLWLCQERWG